jgi:hypothetical protein
VIHSRPLVPGNAFAFADGAGQVSTRYGHPADAGQHVQPNQGLEFLVPAAGTRFNANPFFCASGRDADATDSMFRRCSNPLSWITASSVAKPLPYGAVAAACSNARSVKTACSATNRSESDNFDRSIWNLLVPRHSINRTKMARWTRISAKYRVLAQVARHDFERIHQLQESGRQTEPVNR